MNISVSRDLKTMVADHPETNWSAVAAKAFWEHLSRSGKPVRKKLSGDATVEIKDDRILIMAGITGVSLSRDDLAEINDFVKAAR